MREEPGPRARPGTRALIVGVALSLTGLISIAALVVQLAAYDPSCEPLVAWSFSGPCGALRLLSVAMLPFLLGGLGLVVAGGVLRWRRERPPLDSSGASVTDEREPRQKSRR
ncbi:MAG TPA: hypothetical protein VGG91_08090 [Myxococcaceae bacterium]|jgi:hypothetical protein